MTDIRRGAFTALAIATAAAFYGCSSSSNSDGNLGANGSSSGANDTSDGAAGSGDDSGSTPGDDTTGSSDAGGATSGRDATTTATGNDAGHHADASSTEDAGATKDSGGATASDASADESAWLDPMNAARAAVGDPPLTWNPIAAQVALNYANMCDYVHNPNRDSDYAMLGGGNGGLGENIAAGAPTLTIASANMGWIQGEEPDYDYATNTCNTMGGTVECGHYTQIVWKTTTSVGCAIVTCNTNTPFGTKYGTKWGYAVCDYSPPGNIVLNGTPEKPY
jgi:pathogenesis-related protein 1